MQNKFKKEIMPKSLFTNPTLESLVYKIRDPNTNRQEFRRSLKKIGEYLAVNVSNDLKTSKQKIMTAMKKEAEHNIVEENIVLVTILRAGLPLFSGVLEVFPNADCGFFGMQRNEITLKASVDYIALPPLENKTVIIADTTLATGGSMLNAIKIIEKRNPKKIILICAISAKEGIERILEYNKEIKIYPAVIDPIINEVGYIVPGLGDAGDRCFGKK